MIDEVLLAKESFKKGHFQHLFIKKLRYELHNTDVISKQITDTEDICLSIALHKIVAADLRDITSHMYVSHCNQETFLLVWSDYFVMFLDCSTVA